MQKIKDPISELLLKTRNARNISVPKLASILGIPKDRIYKWEQGESSPKYEDKVKLEAWIKDGNWKNVTKPKTIEEGESNTDNSSDSPDNIAEALAIIKQQNAFLQRILESNLAELSRDVNNNAVAIRAEIRGYGKYQLLKQADWNDKEFAKAMAVVDRIYGEELKIDEQQDNASMKNNAG